MKMLFVLMAGLVSMGFCEEPKMAELRTLDGKVYTQVIIRKTEPDGLSIIHESGTAKVAFENLSSELQRAHGYDPEAARKHRLQRDLREDAVAKADLAAAAGRKLDAANRNYIDAIVKSGIPVWLEVQQNPGGDWIMCRWGRITSKPIYDKSGLSPKVVGAKRVRGPENESNIAVHGLSHLADDAAWSGMVYPCGNVSYETVLGATRTLKQYATTPELAAQISLKN